MIESLNQLVHEALAIQYPDMTKSKNLSKLDGPNITLQSKNYHRDSKISNNVFNAQNMLH